MGAGSGSAGDPGGRVAAAGGEVGRPVRAAGVCPRRGLTVSGPGLRYVWKQGGGCWLASCPGASWVEASGTRAGELEPGGCGTGALARPVRVGGADGGGQLTATPGRPGLPGPSRPRPRRSGGLQGLPGVGLPRGPANSRCPRGNRVRRGSRGAGVPAAWGAGRPLAPRPGRKASAEGRIQR